MLRSFSIAAGVVSRFAVPKPGTNGRVASYFSTKAGASSAATTEHPHGLAPEDMPFLHHGKRARFRGYQKFKSPRKRASKLLNDLQTEAMDQSKEARPNVWQTPFRVGDSIEIQHALNGGVNSNTTTKIRGVVLGIFRKGLDTSVLIRDVMHGQPVERRVPLYSPLLKSLKVLEENFVYKGKRKVKRAKLYFLRDRNPLLTRVTKW